MRAGTVTLRLGTRLVAVRADANTTLMRLRTLFAAWIDDDHPDVPWAFDVQLDGAATIDPPVRGPRPVPQLRLGQTLLARSRSADEILTVLACVLGGVIASQDDTQLWLGMRALAHEDSIVLLDARAPTMAADRVLAGHGVVELPIWNVAVTPPATIEVPPPLPDLDWRGVGLRPHASASRLFRLAGIIAVEPGSDRHDDRNLAASRGELMARFSARHTSTAWFRAVEGLVGVDRTAIVPTRHGARERVLEWLASTDGPNGSA